MTSGTNSAPNEHAKVLELSRDAWTQPERATAERIAAKACEMYVFNNIPMGYISVVAIKIDSRLDRYSFLVRYAGFLIRISVKSHLTKVIGSVQIANIDWIVIDTEFTDVWYLMPSFLESPPTR